jgi:two-component system, NtrC family, sensor kinase
VGETVATLSHHIKNILQALGGGTELVEKALAEGNLSKANFAWPIVRRNLDRINGVILNMLAFSKAREPVMENLNINHVLNECLDLIGPQADERTVAIITDLGDLPPIPADASGLHQAFLNLLNNALDAVADNTGVITVTSSFDTMNRQVIVTVADNGVGIAPDQIGQIFDAFHSTKGHKGTGLGLAVTKKAVEEHGGRITVASKAGSGTTFTVRLSSLPGGIPSSNDTQAR